MQSRGTDTLYLIIPMLSCSYFCCAAFQRGTSLCLQLRLSDSFSDDTLSRNIHAEQTSCGEPERNTSSQRSLLMSMSVENKSYHDVIFKDIVSSSVTDVWWSSLVLQAAEVEAQGSAFAPWSNKKL